jgi:hypothetical protein
MCAEVCMKVGTRVMTPSQGAGTVTHANYDAGAKDHLLSVRLDSGQDTALWRGECAVVQKLAAIVRIEKYGACKGRAVILFPAQPWSTLEPYCTCWAELGGHGAARYGGVIHDTRPATAEETAKWKRIYEAQVNGVPEEADLELVLYRRETATMRREFDTAWRELRNS